MLIEILNWSKYNPRSDVKHTTWFRVENNFYADPAIFRLDNDAKMVWFTVLALASHKMCGAIELEISFVASVLQISSAKVEEALRELQDSGRIKEATSRPRNVRVTSMSRLASRPRTSSNETNSTNETDVRILPSTDVAAPPPGSAVWDAYAGSYLARYGVPPVRNAKANTHCKQLVQALGVDAAIAVVRFYVGHSGAYYVQRSHALGPCVADAPGLHTQWLTGNRVTAATAAVKDRQQSNLDAAKEALRRMEERDAKK